MKDGPHNIYGRQFATSSLFLHLGSPLWDCNLYYTLCVHVALWLLRSLVFEVALCACMFVRLYTVHLCALQLFALHVCASYSWRITMWTSNTTGKLPLFVLLRDQESVGLGKKKEENIFLFCFLTTLRLMSHFQLPIVKDVYVVEYKSMIGGYKTLLVMNSVNPFLIPLRYLNHVWVTVQQV